MKAMMLIGLMTFLSLGVSSRATAGPTTQPATLSLFDGKTLNHWKASDFAGGAEPQVDGGAIVLPAGERLTGITWTGPQLPKTSYEITLQARRVDGADFFCGLTFPVNDSFATLVLGGWGGSLCGISSLDDEDASGNQTKTYQKFKTGQWYHVRLKVLPDQIEAWLDDKQIVNVKTTGKKIGLRNGMESAKPLGISSFQTQAEIKDLRLTPLAK